MAHRNAMSSAGPGQGDGEDPGVNGHGFSSAGGAARARRREEHDVHEREDCRDGAGSANLELSVIDR